AISVSCRGFPVFAVALEAGEFCSKSFQSAGTSSSRRLNGVLQPLIEPVGLHRIHLPRGTGLSSGDRQWMAVFADHHRVGAQDELPEFGLRHLVVVEHMPSGARLAAGLGALQFRATEIQTTLLRQRIAVGS